MVVNPWNLCRIPHQDNAILSLLKTLLRSEINGFKNGSWARAIESALPRDKWSFKTKSFKVKSNPLPTAINNDVIGNWVSMHDSKMIPLDDFPLVIRNKAPGRQLFGSEHELIQSIWFKSISRLGSRIWRQIDWKTPLAPDSFSGMIHVKKWFLILDKLNSEKFQNFNLQA